MINYYKVLNTPESFIVDLSTLESQYLFLQSASHPDNVGGDRDNSSLLNEAYTVLSKPLSRAEHLLQLNGVAVPPLGHDFMEDIMVLCEQQSENGTVILRQRVTGAEHMVRDSFAAGDLEGAALALSQLKSLNRLVAGGTTAS